MKPFSKLPIIFGLAIAQAGCGTYVPQIEEFYERGLRSQPLQLKIKEQIFCELQASVYNLNTDPREAVFVDNSPRRPIPESWGVQMTITLTVLENTSFNPNVAISSPMPSQIFTLGLDGLLTADATRVDKYTFYYLIKDLERNSKECALRDENNPNGREPDDFKGSSLLLTSNLGIKQWLDNAVDVRVGRGISIRSKQEVLSYNVKFNAVSRGGITPSWVLERVAANKGTFMSTKRDRTHELLLTFGPAEEPLPKTKSTRPPQPSALALSDNLASQVGSAVANSINSASPRLFGPFGP